MDVKPAPPLGQAGQATDTLNPVVDVLPPKLPPHVTDKTSQKPVAAKSAQSKQPATNVTLAIVATVVIVLGLAALAAFAYLKQA